MGQNHLRQNQHGLFWVDKINNFRQLICSMESCQKYLNREKCASDEKVALAVILIVETQVCTRVH